MSQQVYGLPFAEEGSSIPGETRGAHCMVQDSQGNLFIGDIYTERAQKFVKRDECGVTRDEAIRTC